MVQEPQGKGEGESDVELEQVRETTTHFLRQHSVTQCLRATALEHKSSATGILPPQLFSDQETRVLTLNHSY